MLRRRHKLSTVGLLNPGNACFANANLQALAALPALYTYLTELAYLGPDASIAPSVAPLSASLRAMILQLNEQVSFRKAISPWPLLRVIEAIYNSRISRSQHDAHEMLHLILETLEAENLRLRKHLGAKASLLEDLVFQGTTLDTVRCTQCGATTQKSTSFLVLSLMVPQSRRTDLNEMLNTLQSPETIGGYGCSTCRFNAVVNAAPHVLASRPAVRELREKLLPYAGQSQDLPPEIEAALPSEITSTIEKSTHVGRLPGILIVHLSRSIYATYGGASRNSCSVGIPEILEVAGEANGRPVIRKYKLYALVRHSGTHYMGHYEASRRRDPFWAELNREPIGPPPMLETEDDKRAVMPGASSNAFSGLSGESPASRSTASSAVSYISWDAATDSSRDSPGPTVVPQNGIAPSFPAKASARTAVSQIASQPGTSSKMQGKPKANYRAGPDFWSISDAEISESSTKQVLSQESAAYLLFYQKVSDRITQFANN